MTKKIIGFINKILICAYLTFMVLTAQIILMFCALNLMPLIENEVGKFMLALFCLANLPLFFIFPQIIYDFVHKNKK